MQGITIRDMVESGRYLAVDLQHVLDLFGERVIQSRWTASEVWATGKETGEAERELDELADGQTFISGEQLSRIARNLVQIIDGEFRAFEQGSASPWIVIRAVDSSFYEVFSPEPEVLTRVRGAFHHVTDCDHVA